MDLSFSRRRVLAVAVSTALAAAAWISPAMAEIKFRISVDTGPNHVRNITLRTFMQRLSEKTGGEVVAELFESGQLYSARDEPRAVARGDIEMSVTSNSAVSAFAADMNLLDMPLFSGRSPTQVNALVDGPLGQELSKRVEEKLGLVVPGRWFLLGFLSTFGAGKDLKNFDDFQGIRVRIPGGAAFVERYKALGAEGVSIPFADVPLALTQGTIDALLTTNETLRSGKLHEAGVKSAFIDQVSVLYYVPLVNKAFWDRLGQAHQQAFKEAWESVIEDERVEALRRQDAAAAENAANGVIIYEPNPDDLAKVNARLLELVPSIASELGVDPAIVDMARSELEKLN